MLFFFIHDTNYQLTYNDKIVNEKWLVDNLENIKYFQRYKNDKGV